MYDMVNVKGKGAAQEKDTEVGIKALRIGMLRVQGILDYIFSLLSDLMLYFIGADITPRSI